MPHPTPSTQHPPPDTRYGFYLRPSYAVCRAQAELHDLLRRQYGLLAAGAFMPHATIKGFFRTDAPEPEIVSRLDAVLADRPAFPVHNRGVVGWGQEAIVLHTQLLDDGTDNVPLRDLHRAALAALLPLVHPDCDFTPTEWTGDLFQAHLTLAMADIPPDLFPEILAFVQSAEPIGPPDFLADTLHLVAFDSADWPGPFWHTLRWSIRHAWRLT